MIAIDASAIAAIFLKEPDAAIFADRLWAASGAVISAATLLELSIVLTARNREVAETTNSWIDDFLEQAGIAVEPVTEVQVRIARTAFIAFGKGTGHPAGLNFGDCFSYALAKALDVPLLFKGGDFAATDIRSALSG